MTTAREEILCPCPDCNHRYTRRVKLPTVGKGETYPDLSGERCQHLIAHPLNNPQWNEDFLAAFLTDETPQLRQLGVDVGRIHKGKLERVRPQGEEIIRKYVKEVDGFFFANNSADIDRAIWELRPILIGLQSAGS